MAKTEIDELIMSRRSIKTFKPDPVSADEVVELLNIAKWAPNHKLTQPWRFLLFSGEGKEKFIQAFVASQPKDKAEATEKKAQYYREIPMHLVVIMPEDPRMKTREEDYGAVAAMIQNFQLAAWARGIGMIWRTSDFIHHPAFREVLEVKPGERVVATLMLGYPDQVPKARPRTDIRELIEIYE